MEGKYSELELLFIEETLLKHGEFLKNLLREQIESKNIKKSGDLLSSLSYKVSKYGINPVLLINFISYGRAIEIRWHRKSKNSDSLSAGRSNRSTQLSARRSKSKDTRWYAKAAYGSVNRLISVLGTDFSKEEIQRLKQIIQHRYELKG